LRGIVDEAFRRRAVLDIKPHNRASRVVLPASVLLGTGPETRLIRALHRALGFGAPAHPIDHHCLGAHAHQGEGRHGDELVFEIAHPSELHVRLGLGRVDTEFRVQFDPQGLVSIMGRQNLGESISIRPFKERVIPTILYLARMAIVEVAILLAAPPRDPIDRISIFVAGRGKRGLIAEHRTQAIMCTLCSFIDVRLLEYCSVEAQQLAVAPIRLGARSKPPQCVCQLGGWNGRRRREAYQQGSA
jgi:hypothetical protein